MLVTCLDYFVSSHLSNNTCISHRSFLIELPCHDIVLPTRRRAIYAAIVRPPSTLVPPPLRPSSHCRRKCLWWQRHGRSKIRNQPLLVRSTSILSTAFEEADCRPLSFWPPRVISCFEGLCIETTIQRAVWAVEQDLTPSPSSALNIPAFVALLLLGDLPLQLLIRGRGR